MGQLKFLGRRQEKDDMLLKGYQETIDTDVKAGYVHKVLQVELNETKVYNKPSATNVYFDHTCFRIWWELFFASENTR